MSGLDCLLTGEDELVDIVKPTDPRRCVKAREPIDKAVGKLFRYCGEDHGVAPGGQEELNGGSGLPPAGYIVQFSKRADFIFFHQSMDVFYDRLMKDDQQHIHKRHSCATTRRVVTEPDDCSTCDSANSIR